MKFEWDKNKEKVNIEKHGITFSMASRIFMDEDRIEYYDTAHSETEDRYITIGTIHKTVVVAVVVYTPRKKAIRIISARAATRKEQEAYYNGKNQY